MGDDDDDRNRNQTFEHDHIHHISSSPEQQTVVDDGLAVLDWVKRELGDSAAQVVTNLIV